jgi:hypothetical protein
VLYFKKIYFFHYLFLQKVFTFIILSSGSLVEEVQRICINIHLTDCHKIYKFFDNSKVLDNSPNDKVQIEEHIWDVYNAQLIILFHLNSED